MEVKFRKAVYDDVESIIKLCNECFFENTNIDYAKNVYTKTENDDNQIYIVGYLNDELVAHAKITIIPTMYEDMNTYSILNHVCVKEKYRRCNIGTRLLEECERISKMKNCSAMKLWSNNFRKPAHECYKNYGFIVNDAKFFSKEID